MTVLLTCSTSQISAQLHPDDLVKAETHPNAIHPSAVIDLQNFGTKENAGTFRDLQIRYWETDKDQLGYVYYQGDSHRIGTMVSQDVHFAFASNNIDSVVVYISDAANDAKPYRLGAFAVSAFGELHDIYVTFFHSGTNTQVLTFVPKAKFDTGTRLPIVPMFVYPLDDYTEIKAQVSGDK